MRVLRSVIATSALVAILGSGGCERPTAAPVVSLAKSAVSQGDGSEHPAFADDFNRSGSLGDEWRVIGIATANGSAATLTGPLTYAAWNGLPAENTSVSATLSSPTVRTRIGIFTRANTVNPERSHYAAFVSSGGTISLARNDDGYYRVLAKEKAAFPSGEHRMTLSASGSSPVQLAVALDGVEVLRHDDASDAALHGAGLSGLFDLHGSGLPLDTFEIALGLHFSDHFDRAGALGSNCPMPTGRSRATEPRPSVGVAPPTPPGTATRPTRS